MAIPNRLKVKSQCDWGLGRQYLSLGEDLAKSFKKHMCLVRPLVRLFHHTWTFCGSPPHTPFILWRTLCFKCHLVWSESECSTFNLEACIQNEGLVCYCSGIVIHQVPKLFLYLLMWQKYLQILCVLCNEQSWSCLLCILLYTPHYLCELLISVSLRFYDG